MQQINLEKSKRAERRVLKIKGFYKHLTFFIFINGLLWLFKDTIGVGVFGEAALSNPKFMQWVDWNILIWGIGLAIHAFIVFVRTPRFIKKWEERQYERFMDEEELEKYE
jgi:hypothetical protein